MKSGPADTIPLPDMLANLRQLVAALDRRVPRLERAAEAGIAREAAELRDRAESLIRQIEATVAKSRA
ncbi:MAG TPA: hypothetical protein VMM93_05900 [Vicinamibacterales bacterium]|nr:hypothetical protein [Vicinamibacterales bacterium]